ncbi:MAG: response regulator transcription factor [Thermodesulfobacteriota bacterium]|nr:response regulator transcription factor [Thermodesulfobacteriota bacterium]
MKNSFRKRILVIEDDKHIAEGLKLNLSLQGYDVQIATDGVSGINKWKEMRPDLIVLDIMLPGVDGISILQSIRLEDEKLPILILSAKTAVQDKVLGLTHGADDYLEKPFNLEEFLLRAERLLTRVSWNRSEIDTENNNSPIAGGIYTFGNNRIDFDTYTAYCKGGEISLTEQEIKLLKLFILNQGRSISRTKILEIGWGYSGDTTSRTVDNYIVRLRKYFEDNPQKPIHFVSRRSVGYIFYP